jgi:hypothetical protein
MRGGVEMRCKYCGREGTLDAEGFCCDYCKERRSIDEEEF